ncbi:MAG: trigger factor [bacterium]|nr:trigger factor [bacterium]
MPATVTDVDACTKKLEVGVPRADVDKEMERAYKRLSGRVRIKGFRKGKIPRNVLERYYSEEVRAEVLNRVISDSYRSLLEEKGMRPVGEPNVTDIQMEDDAPELTYKATVEVIPPFELAPYTGLEVQVKSQPITDEAVDAEIDKLRKSAATFEDVERPSRPGDYVMFDIEGFDGGEPVANTKGENQSALLGEAQAEPELEAALTGIEPGAEREFEVDVPENAPPELQGKKLLFRVKCRSIKEPNPPALDDDFVKSLGRGFSTADELREQFRKDLESYQETAVHSQGIEEMMRKLCEANPFEVPPTLIQNHSVQQIHDYEHQLQHQNPEARIDDVQREQMMTVLAPESERRVRELILVDRVQEKEDIHVVPGEIEAYVQEMAARYRMEPEKLQKRLAMTGGMESIVRNMAYNKTVEWLYERAMVEVIVEEGGSGEEAPEAEAAADSEEKG